MTYGEGNDDARGLLAGRLEGISLPDLLWGLCRRASTGVLRVESRSVRRTVYLDQGRIVFAASSSPDDRLGEQFLKQGRVSLDQLDRAIAGLSGGKRLGTLLVESGAIAPEQLVEGVVGQVKAIVIDLFRWEEGHYRFDEGPLPTDEVITLDMKTSELLLEGIHSIDAFSRIRRSVGPLRTVYGLSEAGRNALDGVRLREGEDLLIVRLEESDESIESLCREVFLSNFEIYQSLWGLKVLGVIEAKDVQPAASERVSHEGRLAETGFCEALVHVCRSDESGVLYVTRDAIERTFHIRHGRCVFATSNATDDGLLAYLLRRGVISLQDREETGKRLLSNKRVGAILQELGVIDDTDLQAMVRQQLREIVYDTFLWEDGDFAFVPGELPSIEEITLEPTLEALVAGGIRRVTSWSRVGDGCGSLDVPLQLRPDYLEILDAMRCGPEEWQVVTALGTPRTSREICRECDLPDFAVCQIIWTLRQLGAVESRPVTQEEPAVEATPEAERTQVLPPESVRAALTDPPSEPEPEPEPELESETAAAPEPPSAGFEMHDVDVASIEVIAEDAENAEGIDPAEDIEAAEVGPPEAASRTVRLSRDEVEDALKIARAYREPSAAPAVESDEALRDEAAPASAEQRRPEAPPGPPAETAPAWDPPEQLDESIARFNAAQRLIYRAIRAEVGAGAGNFLRACCDGSDPERSPVRDAELLGDGSWDPGDLRRAAEASRIEDPWASYSRVIEREIDLLKLHLGEARALELAEQIEDVQRTRVGG